MRFLKNVLLVLLALAALVMLLGLFAKKTYRIERSVEVNAPADVVFHYARFFKNMESWSPWNALDPQLRIDIEGIDGAEGAVYVWQGNRKVGSGRQVRHLVTPERIETGVEMQAPWSTKAPMYMTFESVGDKTRVLWGMDFQVPYPWNGLAIFTDVDDAIGGDFALGLTRLKKNVEASINKPYRGYTIAFAAAPERYYIGNRVTIRLDRLNTELDAGYRAVAAALSKAGAAPVGPPTALYWVHSNLAGTVDAAATLPMEIMPENRAFGVHTLGGRALVIQYFGSNDTIDKAHSAMDDFMATHHLVQKLPVLEERVTDPASEPDTARWLTRLVYFIEPPKR
jgi:effector-binding domain-containing protein